MLPDKIFRESVLPEITGRWDQREPMTPQVQGDWYSTVKDLAASEAIDAFRSFYMETAKGGRFPRPGQFREWRKKTGINFRGEYTPNGLTFEPLIWRQVSMVKVTTQGKAPRDSSGIGWIERKPNIPMMLFVWSRVTTGRWSVRVADERRFGRFTISDLGPAPDTWIYMGWPTEDAPDMLEELLAKDEGFTSF